MAFSLAASVAILERTPSTLETLLAGLPEQWTHHHEGEATWSAFDVVGHLIHGDKTDWMNRVILILSEVEDKTFVPFDRFAQFENSKGKTLSQLLSAFRELRAHNITELKKLNIQATDLEKTGIHPIFGEVSLSQLLATWVVHDLDHLSQIARVMAKQYHQEVGPWLAFLKILRQ